MQTFLFFRWFVPASKWFKKAPMRMMSLLLKGRGMWALVLKVHVGVVALIHQLLLVAPLDKVTVPAPSKHIKPDDHYDDYEDISLDTSLPLSLGRQSLLVRPL
jgi:hypothetical protein